MRGLGGDRNALGGLEAAPNNEMVTHRSEKSSHPLSSGVDLGNPWLLCLVRRGFHEEGRNYTCICEYTKYSHFFPVHPCGEEDDVAWFTNEVSGNVIHLFWYTGSAFSSVADRRRSRSVANLRVKVNKFWKLGHVLPAICYDLLLSWMPILDAKLLWYWSFEPLDC